MRNDCVLKGRLYAPIRQYTPSFTCAHFETTCPAFEVGNEQHEYVGTAVYGESRRRRGSEMQRRHPRAIQVGYQKVEETGASDQACETGMRQEGEGQMFRKMGGRTDDWHPVYTSKEREL